MARMRASFSAASDRVIASQSSANTYSSASSARRSGGGSATIGGAAIGAIAVNFAKTYFTGAFPEYWLYGLGSLFILVTLFLPEGLLSLALLDRETKPGVATTAVAIEEGADP